MSVQPADWFDYKGLKHAFRPAEHGERVAWCGDVIASDAELSAEPPKGRLCFPCAVSHGAVLADHHGANVYRARDPEGLSSGDD